MPGERYSMRMTRGMSPTGVITMFLPMCLVTLAWSVLPDALLPAIEKARAGGMSLRELKRKMLG